IRHTSDHQVVAIVEVVPPGNKSNRHALRKFVDMAINFLRGGIHLLIVDLFPPGPRDPQGIHKAIWDELAEQELFPLPPNQPLALAGYVGERCLEAYVEPTAVGAVLPDMPLFLTPDRYIPVPLEVTYQAAFEGVPTFWRDVLDKPSGS